MSRQKVGRDASRKSVGSYLKTFHDLTKKREQLDHQILRVQGKLLQTVASSRKGSGKKPNGRKKYVTRMENEMNLEEAICHSMVPGEEMTMEEILESLEKTGLYKTNSQYFYVMVNGKLANSPDIERVRRGVYVYRPAEDSKNAGKKQKKAS